VISLSVVSVTRSALTKRNKIIEKQITNKKRIAIPSR
jgi:hypothetical protein